MRRVPSSRRGSLAACLQRLGLRPAVARLGAPGTVDHVAQQEPGHVGEHQGREDLVGVEAHLQEGGQRRPRHAAERAGNEHRGQEPRALRVRKREREAAAGHRPEHELALRPDVPDVGPKADREPHRAERERRHFQAQLSDGVEIPKRREEEGAQDRQRLQAQEHEERAAEHDARGGRGQGRREAHRAGGLRARFKAKRHDPAPAGPVRRCQAAPRPSSGRSPRRPPRRCGGRARADRRR